MLLLTASLFVNYFALRLIDNVVIQNKLSDKEIHNSNRVTASMGISQEILLREADISVKLSFGYATPFIIPHGDKYYEVITSPVNIEVSTSILKFVKMSKSDRNNATFIITNLLLTYIYNSEDFSLADIVNSHGSNLSFYSNSNYYNLLSLAVPPPKA